MEISLFCRHDNLDGDLLGNFVSSKRPPHKSKPMQAVPGESPAVAPAWEKMDKLQSSEPSLDAKRLGEKIRPKSGLIVRGMMAGPVASSPQVGRCSHCCGESGKWKPGRASGVYLRVPHKTVQEGAICVLGWEEHRLCFLWLYCQLPGGTSSPSCPSLPSRSMRWMLWFYLPLLSENTSIFPFAIRELGQAIRV